MTALSTIRGDLRIRLVESTAQFYTDAELNTYINQGYREFARKTEFLERVKAYPLVANQYDYALPSNILKVASLWWQDKWKLEPLDETEFHQYYGSSFPQAFSDKPFSYRLFPYNSKFRLNGYPSSASEATTLNGVHTSSVTTLTLTDSSEFAERGYAILNSSEQVQFYANNNTTALSQVTRGADGSTAASYSGGEAVSEAPLLLYYTCLPADLSADGDLLLSPDTADLAIMEYALALAMDKGGKLDASKYHMSRAEKAFKEHMEEREKMQRDRYFTFKDAENNYWSR